MLRTDSVVARLRDCDNEGQLHDILTRPVETTRAA